MNKPELRIYFTDFWEGFNIEENFLTRPLSQKYTVVIDPVDPQLLVFSTSGWDFLKYNKAVRLFFTGESVHPNFDFCDFSLSFDEESYGGRNLRYPLYILYNREKELLIPKDPVAIMPYKTHFCNMVVSQNKCRYRIEFYKVLNSIKKVDSGGKILNNVGGPVPDKLSFIKKYRFTLAMENKQQEGYTTEKIYEPMLMQSVPIYWGNPRIKEEFNPAGFINVADFGSMREAAEYIVELDNDPQRYMQLLAQPWFVNNQLNHYFSHERLMNFLENTVLSAWPFSNEEVAEREKRIRKAAFWRKAYLFITRRSF